MFALVAALPAGARADHFVTADLPAAAAVSGPQEQVFRAGAMPAVGAYIGSARLALGVRLRAGFLRDGSAPGDHMADPGTGGLVTGGLAARLGLAGGWAELVAGAGVTGHDPVPAFEAGLGWSFSAGAVALGPSVRYLRIVAGGADTLGSANLLLVGLDVRFGRAAPPVERIEATPIAVVEPPPPPPPAPPPPPPVDRDQDQILDGDLPCSDLMASGDAASGCPPAHQAITVEDDRIILDDRVLFDTDRAHVKSAGRDLVAQIAAAWRKHPEWKTLTVEGHTDVRGPDDYNMQLSQLRAERVRAQLVKDGCDPARITAVGFGRTRPRDHGTTPEAHQHNRRVEFVIERGQP